MKNLWRVVIVALLAGAVVFAISLKGGDAKAPTDSVVVKEQASQQPAAGPEAAPTCKSCAADEDKKPEAEPAKAEEKAPAKPRDVAKPEKKPDAAKPVVKPVKAEKPTAKPRRLPRIVDVGAERCIPCKMMIPVLDELRSEYEGKLEVIVINTTTDPDAAKPYKVTSIPTQILYDAEGNEIARHFGFFAKEDIIATFKKHGIEL